MQGNKNLLWLSPFFISLITFGCRQSATTDEKDIKAATPVTVTGISEGPLTDFAEFNATSAFQNKSTLRSTANGFLSAVKVNPGDPVSCGKVLFTLITKEAAALKNSNVSNDSSWQFKGEIKISALQNGIVSSVGHQLGDYVQEGDELATLADPSSQMFYLQVPFEMAHNIRTGQTCEIKLPDEKRIRGRIGAVLPSADLQSQSMAIVVKPEKAEKIPENLIVRVRIARSVKKEACALPKEAVLTDETQTAFWVMKLINDTVAVKIPIQKGIEEDGKIEILEPAFRKSDRIILSGNYGMEDTARVIIVK
jgi:multidrug efflux pump subunit AcrA (membrane-fusion protein)